MANQDVAKASVQELANALRFLAIDAVEKAKSGHPGMPMGMADIATILYRDFLSFDPQYPDWINRDRVILSAGHGSMLLYALNYLTGYGEMTLDQLKNFRQLHSKTPGHPEYDLECGVETTTGPLGQGLATAVGMALAQLMHQSRLGKDTLSHYVYVMASDGDLMEGVSHEAASLAGHLKLDRLIVLYDDNQISIDGPTNLSFSDDSAARFAAYGWHVQHIDGHHPDQIHNAIKTAQGDSRPSLICCRTQIGFGAPNKANSSAAHGSPLGSEEVTATRKALSWPHAPFAIPAHILQAWREIGKRGSATHKAWKDKLSANQLHQLETYFAQQKGNPEKIAQILAELTREFQEKAEKQATRQASGVVLGRFAQHIAGLVGGSADLTPSNNSRPAGFKDVQAGDYGGRYIRFGVREHGMAAALNGMALYGGMIPYGATFLTFSDYARPAIRLSALMRQQVIYIMTHDSIGLGEDGPTHQPVEHLAALRAIPELLVWRPGDAVETAECWAAALNHRAGPSLLALSRQGLPLLCTELRAENMSAQGGYVLADHKSSEKIAPPSYVLIASGSELSLAWQAYQKLVEEDITCRIVSMPCLQKFLQQPPEQQADILGPEQATRIAIEAGVRLGWDAILRRQDHFIGMSGFGASAPATELFAHFGITTDHIISKAK